MESAAYTQIPCSIQVAPLGTVADVSFRYDVSSTLWRTWECVVDVEMMVVDVVIDWDR